MAQQKTAVNTALNDEQKAELSAFAVGANRKKLQGQQLEVFQRHAFEVRKFVKNNRKGVWMIGRRLAKIKKTLHRPRFVAWLTEYVHISEMTANRYMDVYNAWPKLADFNKAVAEADGDNKFRSMYDKAARKLREPNERPSRTDWAKLVHAFNRRLDDFEVPRGKEARELLLDELRTARQSIQRLTNELTSKPKAKAA